jgi:hypothetical protein
MKNLVTLFTAIDTPLAYPATIRIFISRAVIIRSVSRHTLCRSLYGFTRERKRLENGLTKMGVDRRCAARDK